MSNGISFMALMTAQPARPETYRKKLLNSNQMLNAFKAFRIFIE
jgi:hypothetical protein